MLARIRKAIVAGFGAAATALIPALLDAFNVDGFNQTSIGAALGVALTAGVVVGYATFKVRNDGTVNGSTRGTALQ
jgi:hypothetical protein